MAVPEKKEARPKTNRSKTPTTREKLLDAAEIEFSRRGYEACTLRIIAAKYNINLGLIYYYFAGKEDLFKSVFLRRSATLVRRRRQLLAAALRESNNEPLEISELIKCFIGPIIEMMKEGDGPTAYVRLQGILRADSSDFARKLRGQAFNATNNIFIREFQRSCEHLDLPSVVWRFSAMVGAFYSFISHSARVNELAGGVVDSDDIDAAYAQVVPFVTGGFLAPLKLRRSAAPQGAIRTSRSKKGVKRRGGQAIVFRRRQSS